jgi:transcriptional regulator with XRE-family HTH domain
MEGSVDVCLAIKQRLEELGLEQRSLAAAAEVTESYISQLLKRKKLPPAADRTDIYGKMEKFLKLPAGKLSKLADEQRREALKRDLEDPPAPLLQDVREVILGKCSPGRQTEIRAIFERQPFGELERLVTQKLLDVVKRVAKEELESPTWLRLVARLVGRSYEQMRVNLLDFLDTDVFNITVAHCDAFLEPLIEVWDIDLGSFAMEIVLNRRLVPGQPKKFEFVQKETVSSEENRGFQRFLRDSTLSGDASSDEIEFLKQLPIVRKDPTPLYYYRELQNLRDPLHFRNSSAPTQHLRAHVERKHGQHRWKQGQERRGGTK